MEVTRDNNMLMKSPTYSYLMLKHLDNINLGVVDLICTPHITCRQDTTNVYIYKEVPTSLRRKREVF